MIATEKDLEKQVLVCNICNKPLEPGEQYEKIRTHRKSNIIVHNECIKREGL